MQMLLSSADWASSGLPTFDAALDALGPIPNLLYRALEFGTIQNRTYWDQLCGGERPGLHVREMLVRHQAKRFLLREQIPVEEDRFSVETEPLVALVFRYEDIAVRVLKGRNGIVPGCGRSRNRRRFYNQVPQLFLDKSRKARKTKLNLLVLWDFDGSFNLNQLWLACPISAGRTAAQVRCLWTQSIPFAVGQIPTASQVQPGDDDLRSLLEDRSDSADRSEELG
jgi:hypothetical protein